MKTLPLLVVLTALSSSLARGAGAVEREHQLGVDIGASLLAISDQARVDLGPAFGVHYGYGITDQFNLLAEFQYSLVSPGAPGPTEPPTHPAQLWNADVGVTYILDVIRWVPYLGALAGGYLLNGRSLLAPLILPGAQIVLGLDYLVTPRWAVGFEVSEHFLFTDLSLYTSYSTAFARAELRWGK